MPFVWSIGTIIGPAIGGTFANPHKTMPSIFFKTGIFGVFPFLLPNVICATMLFISIVVGYYLLEETHPDMQPWSTPAELANTTAETPLMVTAGATAAESGVDLRHESYGTFNAVNLREDESWLVHADGTPVPASVSLNFKPKVFTRRVIMIVIALGKLCVISLACR